MNESDIIVIGLGANLGNREESIEAATELIKNRLGAVSAVSSIYETAPVFWPGADESKEQGDYLNGVLLLKTALSPDDVLAELLQIECDLGRDRSKEEQRWAARVIDLDIIAAGSSVINTKRLSVPHPEMHKRRFVLEPMLEVCPEWVHPLLGKTVAEMLVGLEEVEK